MLLKQPVRQVGTRIRLPCMFNYLVYPMVVVLDIDENEAPSDAKTRHDPVFITGQGQTIGSF